MPRVARRGWRLAPTGTLRAAVHRRAPDLEFSAIRLDARGRKLLQCALVKARASSHLTFQRQFPDLISTVVSDSGRRKQPFVEGGNCLS